MPKGYQQNTELGHVGTFKVKGPDGKELTFKAKTKGILKQSAAAPQTAPAAAAPAPKPDK